MLARMNSHESSLPMSGADLDLLRRTMSSPTLVHQAAGRYQQQQQHAYLQHPQQQQQAALASALLSGKVGPRWIVGAGAPPRGVLRGVADWGPCVRAGWMLCLLALCRSPRGG
jgi:hypothetical protein